MKQAVIEIGTNSVKYTLGELKDGKVRFLKDLNRVTKLGEGLSKTQKLSFDAIERTAKTVAEYAELAHEDCAEQLEIVGTMALRAAKNANDFLRRAKELSRVEVRVISGEEEARLSFAAVADEISGASSADLLMFDMGGGSTELVRAARGKISKSFSVNIGAVSLTEQFLPEAPAKLGSVAKLKAVTRAELVKNGLKGAPELLIGTGGNITSMFMLINEIPELDENRLTGASVSKTQIEALIKTLAGKTLDERKAMTGMAPQRADTILASAAAALTIMEITESRSLTLSLRGLRHALLSDMLAQ